MPQKAADGLRDKGDTKMQDKGGLSVRDASIIER
jgi:hypothetical protein